MTGIGVQLRRIPCSTSPDPVFKIADPVFNFRGSSVQHRLDSAFKIPRTTQLPQMGNLRLPLTTLSPGALGSCYLVTWPVRAAVHRGPVRVPLVAGRALPLCIPVAPRRDQVPEADAAYQVAPPLHTELAHTRSRFSISGSSSILKSLSGIRMSILTASQGTVVVNDGWPLVVRYFILAVHQLLENFDHVLIARC